MEKVKAGGMQFDAVLINEGQDFSDTMFKVLTELLNPETDNPTVALDENQNLYRKRSSWKDLGVKARGRVHRIDYPIGVAAIEPGLVKTVLKRHKILIMRTTCVFQVRKFY